MTCRQNCPEDREGRTHCRSSPGPVCLLHPDLTPDSIVRQTDRQSVHSSQRIIKKKYKEYSSPETHIFLGNTFEVVNRMSDTLINWRYKKRILTIIEESEVRGKERAKSEKISLSSPHSGLRDN